MKMIGTKVTERKWTSRYLREFVWRDKPFIYSTWSNSPVGAFTCCECKGFKISIE